MENFNWLAVVGAALIPLILGFIWYHPKVFGKAWQEATGLSDEKIKNSNMPVIFGVSIVLSLMLALAVVSLTVHQSHVYSLFQGDESAESVAFLKSFMETHGHKFRSFKHGALHGALAGFFIVLPVLGTNALFERKGFKYILIDVGYWIVALTLMGGVICEFL